MSKIIAIINWMKYTQPKGAVFWAEPPAIFKITKISTEYFDVYARQYFTFEQVSQDFLEW